MHLFSFSFTGLYHKSEQYKTLSYAYTTNSPHALTDTQGNIIAISNSNAEIINRRSYTPFGEIRNIATKEGIQNALNQTRIINRGYSGHEHIDNTELIHMNGRVYDPTIGRFMSADPFIQAPEDTQSYNRYSYVRNNPVNMVDPSGYSWLSKLADRVVGAALITAGYFLAIIPEPTSLTKFIASSLITTGGGLLSGEMQLFSRDANGNKYIGTQGTISTNWGQGNSSLTSHQEQMIASQVSNEAYYDHDITYNYKNMNGGMSESFSYNTDSGGSVALYGGEDKIIITKHFEASLNVNAAVWSNYAYEAATMFITPVGLYDVYSDYSDGNIGGLAAIGMAGLSFVPGGRAGANLARHLKNYQNYGKAGYRSLANGRIRYYSNLKSADFVGEMQGARKVYEWNPATGHSRLWMETLDYFGNIRQVRPQMGNSKGKHYTFDTSGNYTGEW